MTTSSMRAWQMTTDLIFRAAWVGLELAAKAWRWAIRPEHEIRPEEWAHFRPDDELSMSNSDLIQTWAWQRAHISSMMTAVGCENAHFGQDLLHFFKSFSIETSSYCSATHIGTCSHTPAHTRTCVRTCVRAPACSPCAQACAHVFRIVFILFY